MRYPGGIRIESSRHVCIKPLFIHSLTKVVANHLLPDGDIRIAWKREAKEILLELSCPKNVKCELCLPKNYYIVENTALEACGNRMQYKIAYCC